MQLSTLNAKARKHIAPSNFALPKTKQYPIHDLAHARNALARSSGKPEEGKVRAAVYKKFPQLKKKNTEASETVLFMNERFRSSPLEIRLTEGEDGIHIPHRVQLFKTGTFKKLQENGKSVQFKITDQTLSEILENFKKSCTWRRFGDRLCSSFG